MPESIFCQEIINHVEKCDKETQTEVKNKTPKSHVSSNMVLAQWCFQTGVYLYKPEDTFSMEITQLIAQQNDVLYLIW